MGLHHPLLVGATDLDVEEHIRVVSVPEPGGRRERDAVVAEICGGSLDRSRPLWELWILEGLEGGRLGCLMKLHHTLADGTVAANQLLAFARASDAELVIEDTAPGRWALICDALADRLRDLTKLPRLVNDTRRARRATHAIRGSAEVDVPGFGSTPHTRFSERMAD
jgi:diacylglycerol O-acyltransferase